MKTKNDSFCENRLLSVSEPPIIHHTDSIRIIMLDVIIALLPTLIWGVYLYGLRAALLILLSVISSVGFEIVIRLILKKPISSVTDLSAVVTGILISMNIPVSASLYLPVIGAFVAVVIVKQLFGGFGKNFVNPALAAAAVLIIIRPGEMISEYSPVNILMQGELPNISLWDLLFGNMTALGMNTGVYTIGESSALLLILGGMYLLVRRVISWRISVFFIGTAALISYLFPRNISEFEFVAYFILSGGLVLCALFMATDPTTSPVTPIGRIVYGVLCGVITVLLRYFVISTAGSVFAVLVANLAVYHLDKIFSPRVFGK